MLRALSVPLLANDPLFSIWSPHDELYAGHTASGPNGQDQRLGGIVRVDGIAYRWLGGNDATPQSGPRVGWDNPGNDLPGMPFNLSKPDPNLCWAACNASAACGAWSYGQPRCPPAGDAALCWLKSSDGILVPQKCRVSGSGGGADSGNSLPAANATQQGPSRVLPTRTITTFHVGGVVSLTTTFMTAAVPADVHRMARPVTYLSFEAASLDGAAHAVDVYVDATAQLCTNADTVPVEWSAGTTDYGIKWRSMKAVTQEAITDINGADRANYGTVYVATAGGSGSTVAMTAAPAAQARSWFAANATLPPDSTASNASVASGDPVLGVGLSLRVTADGASTFAGPVLFAYDFPTGILFFGMPLPPLWTCNASSAPLMLSYAAADFVATAAMCEAMDANVTARAMAAGGARYAALTNLAHRQAYASTTLVWHEAKGTYWQFVKEISSDGDLSTVDVMFPMSPILVLQAPLLLYRLLVPVLEYANNATDVPYDLAWAPHHLGKYPVGNIVPSKQEQMPVEETGNMLIMLAAIAKATGSVAFIDAEYWPLLETWGAYLWSTAFDPGNQLCTDDFEGPSPHNSNLAAKGIVGMGAYGQLLAAKGDTAGAAAYAAMARNYSSYWVSHAQDPAGDHYKLEYDKAGTWSSKYNLLWDRLLGTGLFPATVFDAENKWYAAHQMKFGVPLDNRATFLKADWLMWLAAFQSDEAQAQVYVSGLFNAYDAMVQRVPLTDWFYADSGVMTGFRCRAVVGGFFAPMLAREWGVHGAAHGGGAW